MFKKSELIGFSVLGIIACFIPLLGHVHFESASLITLIVSFYVIIKKETKKTFIQNQLLLPYLVFIPLFFKGLIFGCLSFDGIAFWIVLPIPSLLLIHSIRNLVQKYTQFDRLVTGVIFFSVAAMAPLLELKQTPIVYVYNAMWGYWPGPIYDEEVHFPIQLLIHRFYVLVWAVLCWELVRKELSIKRVGISFLCLMSLFLSFRSLGIIRTTADIAQSFSTNKSSGLITLFYNSTFTDEVQAGFYLKELDYHFKDLQKELGIQIEEQIVVFLYDDPWHKKELVGAKYTQFTPVWLNSYQIHIDRTSFEGVVRHEMVHLVSKAKVSNLLGANWNIGITEGLATAFDPDISTNSTLHEFVAAGGIPNMSSMKGLFSFIGFYTQSSYNAYYKSGSFIQFLAQSYPISSLINWYAGGKFEEQFSIPLDSALSHWQKFLKLQEVDSTQKKQSVATFERPSLFEISCPRRITPEYALWDLAKKALTRKERNTYSSLLRKGLLSTDENWRKQFSLYFAYDLLNRMEIDSSFTLLKTLPENGTTQRLLYDIALIKQDSIVLHKMSKEISPNHQVYTSEKNKADYVLLRYKKQIPAKPNPTLLPLYNDALDEPHTFIDSVYTQELIDKHKIQLEFIRAYISFAKTIAKEGKVDQAIQFLNALELQTEKKQHRFIVQQAQLFIQQLK